METTVLRSRAPRPLLRSPRSLPRATLEHLVISPRWGRLRRQHPLLATSPRRPTAPTPPGRPLATTCSPAATAPSSSALTTYQHRIRIEAPRRHRLAPGSRLRSPPPRPPALDRHGDSQSGVTVRRVRLLDPLSPARPRRLRPLRIRQHLPAPHHRRSHARRIQNPLVSSATAPHPNTGGRDVHFPLRRPGRLRRHWRSRPQNDLSRALCHGQARRAQCARGRRGASQVVDGSHPPPHRRQHQARRWHR